MSTLTTVRSRYLPPKAVMQVANIFVELLLQSPLHGLISTNILLLTYTGRTRGRRYNNPLGYRRDGSTVTVVAGNPWWKNLCGGARVTLHIRGEDLREVAVLVEHKAIAA